MEAGIAVHIRYKKNYKISPMNFLNSDKVAPPHNISGVIMEYLPQILSFLGGLFAGWTLKVIVDKSKNSTTVSGNMAGGDIAGRDIKKK